jgi:hypothetical protein
MLWIGARSLMLFLFTQTLPREISLQMLGRVLVVAFGFVAAPHGPVDGSYVARTMNGHALPTELRIPVSAGDVRLFRLEQGVLRLGPGVHFSLYFRYYHQLVRRGERPTSTPVISESETGTYVLNKHELLFTPAKKEGARRRPTIPATIVGDEIRASYLLQNGSVEKRIILVLRRDASFW